MAATLTKEERLSGKTAVAALMKEGSWGHYGHFKYCILSHEGGNVNRIMVSVPKKHFKRAVKRNLLKRRIREAYRTQKDLLNHNGTDILFYFNSNEIAEYDTVRAEVGAILKKI